MDKPRLQTLILEMTQDCDHACLYCYNPWRRDGARPESARPPTDAPALLAHVLAQVDCGHVTLTGGEPLLCDDLAETVGFLSGRGVRVNLITNGHRLTDARAAELIQSGVSLFAVPLLSHRREVHDALCGAPGAFDAALAALARIRAHSGRAAVAFVATRLNIADLRDTLRLAFAFGVRGIQFNRFNPGGRGAAHLDLLPTLEQVREALAVADATATQLGLTVAISIPIQPCLVDVDAYPNLNFGFCAAGTDRAYYTLDRAGNVRPCNHSDTVLGNVWERRFADIISGQAMAEFAAAIPPFCQACRMRAACQGGCKAAARVCYGDLRAEEPFLHANLASARPLT